MYTKMMCAAYLACSLGAMLPKVNLSSPAFTPTMVPTDVVGRSTIQEIIQMGVKVMAITRRKRTKK